MGSPRPDIFCLNSKGNTTIYDLSVLHYSSGKDVKVEAPFTFKRQSSLIEVDHWAHNADLSNHATIRFIQIFDVELSIFLSFLEHCYSPSPVTPVERLGI